MAVIEENAQFRNCENGDPAQHPRIVGDSGGFLHHFARAENRAMEAHHRAAPDQTNQQESGRKYVEPFPRPRRMPLPKARHRRDEISGNEKERRPIGVRLRIGRGNFQPFRGYAGIVR